MKIYLHSLAKLCLEHGRLPEHISPEEYVQYYDRLIVSNASRGQMKHAVYAVRYYFKQFPMLERPRFANPKLPREKKLPRIPTIEEIKAVLKNTTSLRDKCAIGLLYGSGLRNHELRSLQISDLNFETHMIHVRQGKGSKDRFVPLSLNLEKVLKRYFQIHSPSTYVIESVLANKRGRMLDSNTVRDIVRKAFDRIGLKARRSCHTLRHAYATHFLQLGGNIIDLQANMGHRSLNTTMVYLHIVQPDRKRSVSPLDIIYPVKG